MKHHILIFSFMICMVSITFGGIVHVPADQPTIQAGINAANIGDTVLVAEGTYYENINFMGKAITVASHFILDQNEKHIRKTVIDGSQPDNPDIGSVVSFVSGENTNSVLCAFTITGGTGTLEIFPGFPPIREGGGVLCSFSGATIIHNRIIKNNVENNGWAMGGGISTGPPFIPIFVIIEDNVVCDNTAKGIGWTQGGGINLSSSGRIVNNIIENNTVYSLEDVPSGGGISASSFNPSMLNEALIDNNIILHNKALQNDGAAYWLGGIGGGINILLSKANITNNLIQHNEVSAANNSFGSGILFDFPPDEVYFRNNIVSHNYFSGEGECFGGGFAVWDGNPILENNIFQMNKATYGGGGWIGDAFSFTKVINNTIIKNQAESKGGAIYTKGAAPVVMNSILWNNKAPEGSEIFVESGTIDVSYSNIAGGWVGTGNIDEIPNLVSNSLLLQKFSPCIDAGNPLAMYNDPDNPDAPGTAKYPSMGMLRNDMGAYGGPYASNWNDFLGKMGNEELQENETLPKVFALEQNYPNPFNPSTTIQYTISKQSYVSLKVFDMLGREVTTLINEKQPKGNYQVAFNASNLTSGVYFYRLETSSGFAETKKLVLLK
ncbi:MAG: T9SS type A sorting domain-containing protein [Bacteroidota bacterium]